MEKVYANGESVATMGTDHVAVNDTCAGVFDELLIPPKHTPTPTLNMAFMPTLQNGSKRTRFGGSPVWTTAGTLSASEEYNPEPAGSVGKKSSKAYRGVARPIKGSANVFVEGNPVVRHNDPTSQDSVNSTGKVLMKADLDRLKKALDDELKRRAAKGTVGNKRASTPPRQIAKPPPVKPPAQDPFLAAKLKRRAER
jgi:uncharacterized Zn-binding protein involved in type VI secretion